MGPKTFPNRQPRHPKLPEETGQQGHSAEGGEREKGHKACSLRVNWELTIIVRDGKSWDH